MDVDGTLTDGQISYDSRGGEMKSFSAADGLGIVMARLVGLKFAVITGRMSDVVQRRMSELGVEDILQGVTDKASAVRELMTKYSLESSQIAYIGDDLNDLPAFGLAGTRIAVADAAPIVRHAAEIVVSKPGGHGAVREAIEEILRHQSLLDDAIKAYLARQNGGAAGQ